MDGQQPPRAAADHGLRRGPAGLGRRLLAAAAGIIAADGSESVLRHALGGDWKGKLSPVFYLAGIAATLLDARLGQALFALVALLWLIPDRRIEHELEH